MIALLAICATFPAAESSSLAVDPVASSSAFSSEKSPHSLPYQSVFDLKESNTNDEDVLPGIVPSILSSSEMMDMHLLSRQPRQQREKYGRHLDGESSSGGEKRDDRGLFWRYSDLSNNGWIDSGMSSGGGGEQGGSRGSAWSDFYHGYNVRICFWMEFEFQS